MKWEGNRQSDNVEDRRDDGAGGGGRRSMIGGRGVGVGTIVIALVGGWIFGINPLTILGALGGGATPAQVFDATAIDPWFVDQLLSLVELHAELVAAPDGPLAEPLLRALQAIRADRSAPAPAVVHFTPTGQRIDQAVVREFAAGPGAVLLCGRYEGVDQRVIDRHVTQELSLGDFVLSGGELPALALLDAVARLQDGVLSAESHQQDSFSDGLLEGPQYSRPEVLQIDDVRVQVPTVLMSGHHGQVAAWRRQRALHLTAQRRPDLIAAARAAGRLSRLDEQFLAALGLQSKAF